MQLLDLDRVRYSGGGISAAQKYFRKSQDSKGLMQLVYKVFYKIFASYRHLEISTTCSIGPGLYLGHVYNITINPKAVIGKNCNIHRGVLIGQENRGKKEGTPTIGDCVWIGINACIVGNIKIGNDVLIAPNSYVNCDVPDHSIVFGNPCIIKHRDNATEDYINRRIE